MARTVTSQLIMELLDRVTGPARRVSTSLKGVSRTVRDAQGQRLPFNDRLDAAMMRNEQSLASARMGLLDTVGAYYALKGAIAAPVQEAIAFESAMADVKKVVDFPTPKAFKEFQNDLLALSKQVPMSVTDLANIAAAAGQAGIAGKDLLKFTEAAAKIGVAFDITADDAGSAMAKMMTGLGLTVDEVVKLSDAMNHLSNAQASSAGEILDVVRRVGADGKMFGFTAEQTAAFASAMISAGAETEVAATSFRNMGKALTRGDSATKRQRLAFKALGLDARRVAKDMQTNAVATSVKVMEQLASMPAETRAALASDLFGDEARALGPLLTNLGLVKDSLGLVADEAAYSGSAFKEFEVRNATFGAKMQRFNNQMTALKITIGSALIPVLSNLIDKIAPVIEGFSTWVDLHPILTANLMSSVGALVAFKGALSGLRFVGLLGAGGALSMMSAGVAALGPAFAAVGAAIATISAPVWGAVVAGVAVIAAAGATIYNYWDRISSIFGGVGRAVGEILAPALEKVRPILDWFAPLGDAIATGWGLAKSVLSSVGNWFSSFFTKETLTEEGKAAYEKAGYDLVMAFWNGMKAVMSRVVSWVTDTVNNYILAPFTNAINGIAEGSGMSGGAPAVAPNRATPFRGKRAKGGPISPGRTYLVGEDGPEVITPNRSGYVNSSGSGGAASAPVTINHTMNFSGVSATDAQAIAALVMARIRDDIGMAMRGVMADVGMGA